jgi:hypothetical protein
MKIIQHDVPSVGGHRQSQRHTLHPQEDDLVGYPLCVWYHLCLEVPEEARVDHGRVPLLPSDYAPHRLRSLPCQRQEAHHSR